MARGKEPSTLILEDGSVFYGYSFGSRQAASGEVVFNTGMVGYPESLTDASYRGQILVLTYPLIGNYGVPGDERDGTLPRYLESDRIHVEGLVVGDYSDAYSHWNAKRSLSEWMEGQGVAGICGVDTRGLTKRLREKGTMLGKIVHGGGGRTAEGRPAEERGAEANRADGSGSSEAGAGSSRAAGTRAEYVGTADIGLEDPNGRNLVAEVSIEAPVAYDGGKRRVIVVDCGTKKSIIRAFIKRGLSVLRCPWDHDFSEEAADGIVISNGPGDPKMCVATVENVRKALSGSTPILGICLGSQVLALAAGADTYKLKYGHRGQNQPCVEVGTRRCYITTQNHGYAIDAETLPEDWREWFYNNNDKTNEGIIHISKPFFGAQFHPEASPGPDDTEFIFDLFVRAMR
jgi:carbamoyl-phosphate synthase small subunit